MVKNLNFFVNMGYCFSIFKSGILTVLILLSFFTYSQTSKEDSLISLLQNADNKENPELLTEAVKVFYKSSPEKAIEFGQRLIALSDTTEINPDIYFYLAVSNSLLRNYDTTIVLLGKAKNKYKEKGDDTGLAQTISQLAYTYYRKGDLKQAYRLICKAQDISKNLTDNGQKAVDMYRRGVFAKRIGKYKEAIEYYNKAISVYKSLGSERTVGQLYGNIGNVFIKMNQPDKALGFHLKALEIHKDHSDSANIAGVLNDIGNDYYKMHKDSLALVYYFKAIEINKQLNNDIWLAYNMSNVGTIYSETNKPEKAVEFLKKAIELKSKAKDVESLTVSYASLGSVYKETGDYGNALKYLLKAYKMAKDAGTELSIGQILKDIAEVYSLTGRNKKAYEYQKKYSTFLDSVFNKEKIKAVNEIQEKYATAEREKEIQQLKFDKRLQDEKQTIYIVIIISLFIFISLVILNFYIKMRKDKQILLQKEVLHKREKELAEMELEKRRLKELELQRENDFKSRQLTTHALNMMQKNNLLSDLQKAVKELSKKTPLKDNPEIVKIKRLIAQSMNAEKDWDVFKSYFEQVNKNFYTGLKKINPELTAYDMRLCALIRLNLNIKETASVLNLAPNSIKSARYRLRKKLGINQDDDLYEFIMKIN